jgi:hypothetical protein
VFKFQPTKKNIGEKLKMFHAFAELKVQISHCSNNISKGQKTCKNKENYHTII